jgi:SAM-dependent methyltransferase
VKDNLGQISSSDRARLHEWLPFTALSKGVGSWYDHYYQQQDLRRNIADPLFIKTIFRKIGARRGCTVLDVGCGTGYFSNLIATTTKCHVTGIDLSSVAISLANQRYDDKCEFVHADFLAFPSAKKYDVVFCSDFSELNVEALAKALPVGLRLVEHLADLGWLVISWSTDLSGKKGRGNWMNHDLQHFKDFMQLLPLRAECFATHRLDQIVLRRFFLSRLVSRFNCTLGSIAPIPGWKVVALGKK